MRPYFPHKVHYFFATLYGIGLAPLLLLPIVFIGLVGQLDINNVTPSTLLFGYVISVCTACLLAAYVVTRLLRATPTTHHQHS